MGKSKAAPEEETSHRTNDSVADTRSGSGKIRSSKQPYVCRCPARVSHDPPSGNHFTACTRCPVTEKLPITGHRKLQWYCVVPYWTNPGIPQICLQRNLRTLPKSISPPTIHYPRTPRTPRTPRLLEAVLHSPVVYFQNLTNGSWFAVLSSNGLNQDDTANWRIERLVSEEGLAVLYVSGRLKGQHVETLRDLLAQEKGGVAIDLKHVLLVDEEAVRFLALCETKGTELRNCPAYIREWVNREKRSY